MSSLERSGRPSSSSARRIFLATWLVAGTLDISWAAVQTLAAGGEPAKMLRAVASGVLGAASFQGGAGASALGLVMHFFIMLGVCATYFAIARMWPAVNRSWLIVGPIFGVGVFFFMKLVVLPLSRVPWKVTYETKSLLVGLAAHVLCIGLPIAYGAMRAARVRRA